MDREQIELTERGDVNLIDQDFSPTPYSIPLPPADTGKDAWLFLAACFMVEALVWGFPFTFGLFQEYYSAHQPFSSTSNIAVIGTCSMVGNFSASIKTSLVTSIGYHVS